MEGPASRRRPSLADLTALVVGYGMAALLVRALWPAPERPTPLLAVLVAVEYLWLGLAMSGPIVLLIHRRGPLECDPIGAQSGARIRYTRAELAWLSIGAYWIAMTIFVVPARLRDTPLPLLTVFQGGAAIALWIFAPRAAEGGATWTHRAAVALLVSWPPAWAVLILLGLLLD